jgi:TolA-binding protein
VKWLLFLALWPARAHADCPLVDERELERLIELELGARSPRLELRCRDGRAELRVDGAARTLELAATPASARARLIALTAAELSREPLSPPPTTTRTTSSEKRMWKRLLAVTLVAAPAVAAPPPKPEARVEARPTALTRPAPRAHEPPAPALRAEDVFTRVGDKVHAVTDAQIRLLERLIAQSDGDEKADLLLRAGDLHADQQRYFRFRARSLDQPIFDAGRAGRDAAPLRRQQQEEETREQLARKHALERYLDVVNGPFASYPKMDEALFSTAQLLREAKKDEAARTFFKRLIKDHPTSRYVPDGLLAFGDDAFERHDLETALALYDKVVQHADSPLAEYARYKIGWCRFNLADFKGALDAFVTVIDHARHGQSAGRLALEREARKDVVRAFAQVGAADRAWPFFQRLGGGERMLEQLAELYDTEGRFLDAIRLYRQLMALQPSSPRLCAWQLAVAKSTLAHAGSRAEPETVRELERLVAVEVRARDSECRDTTAQLVRELATVWHGEAQRTKQKETYAQAAALYRLYLKTFPDARDAPTLSYYAADALYQLERWCDAAPLFSEATRRDVAHREDAAFGAVVAWRECLHLDDTRPVAQSRGTPRAIPEPWRKMIDAFELYLRYVPNGADRVRVQYQEALAFYELDHCQEAMPLFGEIARRHQDSPLAPYAADLLFDCRAQRAEKAELRAESRELCAAKALTAARPDFAARCRVIQVALLRAEAEAHEAAKEWRAAAELYVQAASEFPDDPKLDELLYDAGVDYQRANMIGLSILANQQLLARRPDSPLARKAVFSVGRSYQQIAAFDAAAENYERYAARWPDERDAPTALRQAAFLRGGLGDLVRAHDDAQKFLARYGGRDAEAAAAVAFAEGQIFEQQRDWPGLAGHLHAYLEKWGARGGVDREVIAHVKLGELAWRASCPVAGVWGACVEKRRGREAAPESCGGPVQLVVHARKPERVREAESQFEQALTLYKGAHVGDETRRNEMAYHAAEARMLLADAEFERFLALKLPASRKKLAAWFAAETQQLERTRRSYESVILMKQAHWAIAAAGRVGQMFQTFAAQVNSSPVPPAPPPPRGVDAKQWREDFRSAFCDGVAAHVVTLEDKAEDALKLCLDKSTELSWFNEWSAMCEAELHAMKPRTYSLAVEVRAEPGFTTARAERVPLAP